MADTPDLSRIINVIMQNPALIEQIAALANVSSDTEKDSQPIEEETSFSKKTQEDTAPVAAKAEPAPVMKTYRRDLINAMKPYLSENRRSAIDSMSSILDVIDVMMKK